MRSLINATLFLASTTVTAGDYLDGLDQAPVINGCTLERNAQCSGADLRGADLSNLDLRMANFQQANLAGANLRDRKSVV